VVATKPWTMQLARAAARLMAAALRGSPVAFGAAFGTGFGAGFATATGVMFLDDDVQRLEILERLERHVDLLEAAARAAEARARRRARTCLLVGAAGCLAGAGVLLWRARRRHRARRRPRDAAKDDDGNARWRSGDPRVVLGVGPFASRAACRAAYLELARRYHPDKSGSAATGEAFAAINAAWTKIDGGAY
jgi:hypothetical protein